jgi:hypothetical protein
LQGQLLASCPTRHCFDISSSVIGHPTYPKLKIFAKAIVFARCGV